MTEDQLEQETLDWLKDVKQQKTRHAGERAGFEVL
jgi:hypothetical protein